MEGGGGEHLVEGGGGEEQSLKTAQSVQGCFRQDRRVLF